MIIQDDPFCSVSSVLIDADSSRGWTIPGKPHSRSSLSTRLRWFAEYLSKRTSSPGCLRLIRIQQWINLNHDFLCRLVALIGIFLIWHIITFIIPQQTVNCNKEHRQNGLPYIIHQSTLFLPLWSIKMHNTILWIIYKKVYLPLTLLRILIIVFFLKHLTKIG